MPSIDALASAIGTARERIEAIVGGIAASLAAAAELGGRFRALGADDKAGQVEQVT